LVNVKSSEYWSVHELGEKNCKFRNSLKISYIHALDAPSSQENKLLPLCNNKSKFDQILDVAHISIPNTNFMWENLNNLLCKVSILETVLINPNTAHRSSPKSISQLAKFQSLHDTAWTGTICCAMSQGLASSFHLASTFNTVWCSYLHYWSSSEALHIETSSQT
jgi:hypothetical protein